MRAYQTRILLGVMVGLFCLSGANCPFLPTRPANELANVPPALPPAPTREQVIEAVNRNSGLIQSLVASDSTLSVTGTPTLRLNLAYERPMRLRIQAGMTLTGPELDLGSNDQVFWFWIRRNEPKGLFYCSHEQFSASPLRQQLPLDPYVLPEALGIVYLDPSLPHSNLTPVAGGRYELQTTRQTPEGPATKVTVVDGIHGLVLEQRYYDARRQLVASVATGQFRRDPLSGAFYPTQIDLRWPAAQMAMQMRLGAVQINRQVASPEQLWAMPNYDGWPAVDLCRQ